ncbi:ABC-2 family transporter protein [Evansella caseinilytica]|uniref:ABC-2 family transporter protein n=1 Tax=Evansella caseinilytica TaxID=1503961 RepID=A0A1H3Q9S5_9BACI|nr:ABC-2 transporter permease [Evansella caseinilytica]SDZ09449.1 ABC-2 family transporter protein [Evansella caseinilytica]
MLFNLVKKDFLLAKKYILAMVLFAVAGPIFIYSKLGISGGSFISFLITLLFVEYILFNMVAMTEDKYKGAALLCTTPYTRNGVVKAKFLFILVLFICCFLLYNLATVIVGSSGLERLSMSDAGTALLIVAVFFGILIPFQFYFGYEKTKYISFFVIFLTPFILPGLIQLYQELDLASPVQMLSSQPRFVSDWLPFIAAFLIGIISMHVSVKIYSEKNL